MLFLLLLPVTLSAINCASDTLILDTDTIFFEKREKRIHLDSLQEESADDIRNQRKNQHRFSLLIEGGWNQSIGNFQSSFPNLTPLDNFIKQNTSRISNFTPAIHLGYRIWQMPTKSGAIALSGHGGIRYNQINIHTTQLQPEELQKDSIIKLEYIDKHLELIYFTIFDTTEQGIIGELDTLRLNTSQSRIHFKTIDFPLALRFTHQPSFSALSWFVQAGMVYRKLLTYQSRTTDNYLINEQAEYRIFHQSYFLSKNILIPQFSVGANIKLTTSSKQKDRWHLSVCYSMNLPARSLNPEGFFSVHQRNNTLSFGIRYTL